MPSGRPAYFRQTSFPSRIVANIAMIAVILAASIEAARQVGGDDVAAFLAQITATGSQVIFGTLIIVVGIFLARIIANLIASGTSEGSFAQTIVRYAIITLFGFMGLSFMGLADDIVNLAFGLVVGAAAVATALAFGLGGRDAAARALERWADVQRPPSPPCTAAAHPQHADAIRRAAAAGLMTWDEAVAFALTLPDTELGNELRQAGGEGRVERPRLPLPEPRTRYVVWRGDRSRLDRDVEGDRSRQFLAERALRRLGRRPDPLCHQRSRTGPRGHRALARLGCRQAQGAAARNARKTKGPSELLQGQPRVAPGWPLRFLRRDRLVGREGQEAQGHRDRRSTRRRRAAPRAARPCVVTRAGTRLAGQAKPRKSRPCSASTSASRRR